MIPSCVRRPPKFRAATIPTHRIMSAPPDWFEFQRQLSSLACHDHYFVNRSCVSRSGLRISRHPRRISGSVEPSIYWLTGCRPGSIAWATQNSYPPAPIGGSPAVQLLRNEWPGENPAHSSRIAGAVFRRAILRPGDGRANAYIARALLASDAP